MFWRRLWTAAVLLWTTDANHHSPHRLQAKAVDHRHSERRPRVEKPAVPAAEVQLVERHSNRHHGDGSSGSDPPETSSKTACNPDLDLLRHVMGTQRKNYFKSGEPYNGAESHEKVVGLSILNLPRGCQHWQTEEHCCNRGFFKKISETTKSIVEDFAFVRDQYHNFEKDVVEPAQKAAMDDVEVIKRLTEATTIAAPGIQTVLDFIDKCEDPLRLFFSSTACSLCAPNLEKNLTEDQTLHVGLESSQALQKGCQKMPDRLEEAGRAFLKARDLLIDISQEPWYNHTTTWLDRAGKLALIRSKKVSFYKTEDFFKVVERQGYTYSPELWGNVLMLHISSLASDQEKQSFLPQNELHYFIPKVGQLEKLKKEAETIESEFQGTPEALIEIDAEESESAEVDEGRELKCEHGEHRGSHCACYECWSGIECDKPMPVGPYVQQDFEPLVVQIAEGAQQSLAIQGCALHADLRHQLARITLIPGHHPSEATDKAAKDSLCRMAGSQHTESLKARVPHTVAQDEYIYLIDIPLGESPWYQVCYCYGVDCTDASTSDGWYSLGEVQVVESHQDRDKIVTQMFTPEALKERRMRQRETKKNCSHTWVLPHDATFYLEHYADTITFKCRTGFINLKGVSELSCDNGFWKVSKHSSDSPVALKMSPKDMTTWEDDFPACSWAMAELCTNETAQDVISKDSPPVVNSFSGDGLVHYRCQQEENEMPMRIAVKGLKELQPKQQVVVHGTEVAELLGYDQKNNKYKVRFLKGHTEEVEPAKLESLLKETSFTRRCEGGKIVPLGIEIRCFKVPEVDDLPEPVEVRKVGVVEASFLEEHEAVRSQDLSQKVQLVKEEHAHLKMASKVVEVVKEQPFLLRPWPVKLSADTDRVFRVDSCWTSPLNCSDGQPAEDTARYLQKESVRHEDLAQTMNRSWILGAGGLAVALLVVSWCSLRERSQK